MCSPKIGVQPTTAPTKHGRRHAPRRRVLVHQRGAELAQPPAQLLQISSTKRATIVFGPTDGK